jgi:cytochrome c
MAFGRIIPTITAISLLSAMAFPAMAQDGGALFKQRCMMCHSVTPGAKPGMGPNLAGVGGRTAASTSFAYSPALKASKLKWDSATLDKFLSGPGKLVPGTRMVISVPDAKQRAALVAYLATLK